MRLFVSEFVSAPPAYQSLLTHTEADEITTDMASDLHQCPQEQTEADEIGESSSVS